MTLARRDIQGLEAVLMEPQCLAWSMEMRCTWEMGSSLCLWDILYHDINEMWDSLDE